MASPPAVGKCNPGHGFGSWSIVRNVPEKEAWQMVLTVCPEAKVAGLNGVTAREAHVNEVHDWCRNMGVVIASDAANKLARAIFKKRDGAFILLERSYTHS